MRLNRLLLLVLILFLLPTGCGGGGGGSSSSGSPTSIPQGSNVLSVTVNGSLCSNSSAYLNKPCVSIRVCSTAGPTNCLTVNDVLLDTGSSGLRIFKQALNGLTFEQVTVNGSASLAECIRYGDNSTH